MLRILIFIITFSISSLVFANASNFLTESYCRSLTQLKSNNFNSTYYFASIELANAIESNVYNSCICGAISGITEEKYKQRKPYVCMSKDGPTVKSPVNIINIDAHFNTWFMQPGYHARLPSKQYIINKRDNINHTNLKLSDSEELMVLNYEGINLISGKNAVYINNHRNGTRSIVNMTCYDVNAMTKEGGNLVFN
jgi:hypothetical protein